MKKTLVLLLFLPLWSVAQVTDDFSDGDFSAHPAWVGTDSSFMVNNNYQLQLAASGAGEAWLSTPISSMGVADFEWRFWIKESFSPSGNNYAVVWLCADTAELPMAKQGYFLRFGASGSQDAIELYRKDPDGEQLVCKGTDAAIATSFHVAVKVNRYSDGRWTLMTDYDNVGNYATEAEGIDDTYSPEGHFGFRLQFTVSNAKKFYFDDIYVGPRIIDDDPPELLGLETRDTKHLLLTFSEVLDATALEPQHYRVDDLSSVVPDTVRFDGNPSRVLLCFNESLPENTLLQLRVTGIIDLAGNIMTDIVRDFSIYRASENDVVINEIMADPTPAVGLPECEYVELFNTTSFAIDLKDWTFVVGTNAKTFPEVQIDPLGYLILCKTDAEQELKNFGRMCGFSSFTLANTGASLRLFSPDETLVSEVSFNDNWYHDASKKDGGWSLEQIDPNNPCAGAVNWSASVDETGGTPGRVNSISAHNEIKPQVARVSMLGSRIVLLWFDQQMDRTSLTELSNYVVEELELRPASVLCNPLESSSMELVFDFDFQEGEVYTLVINGVESCGGLPIEADTKVHFGIPNVVSEGDILINEILFDPISPGVDYVELYNRSDKPFDLSELKLGVIKESFPNPVDTVLKEITDESRLFMPHSYVLLSTDGYTVGQQYGCATDNFFDMRSFPSYANSGGVAMLMSRQGVTVDQMTFSEKMHYPLLKETKGVALERVSWEVLSDQADNWHSAAEAVGFGTPGYQNSMMSVAPSSLSDNSHHPITISPSVFSPDGDGFDDSCLFTYQFETSGRTMNVYVFNVDGQLVRHLVKGELIGQEGSFVWNGMDDRDSPVPIGIYVVVTEVFDLEGEAWRYKSAVAVASR